MTFWEFALFAYVGGFIWSAVFIALGYLLEGQWARATERIHYILLGCSVAVLVSAAGYLLVKKLRSRRDGSL